MDFSRLGERIKEERIKRHLTQEKMAETLDISASYLGQIERGERNPTLDTLVMIANNFDVTIDYLLRDSLKTYAQDEKAEWIRFIEGKSHGEKQMMLNVINAIHNFIEGK